MRTIKKFYKNSIITAAVVSLVIGFTGSTECGEGGGSVYIRGKFKIDYPSG